MKKFFFILLTLTACLSLAACSQSSNSGTNTGTAGTPAPPPSDTTAIAPPDTLPQQPEEDTYTLQELIVEGSTLDEEDGTVLAQYTHQLYTMEVPETASEQTKTKAAVFNSKTEELKNAWTESGLILGQDAQFAKSQGYTGPAYTSESATAAAVMGDIISLKIDGYGYSGGAHPNTWTTSNIFDWAAGTYIDPTEIADDPELFRATVTDQILDQIAGLDADIRSGYFTGYEEVVARWNEYCVAFLDSGLEITFSTYELGPYAMGPQVFTLSYEELEASLGEMGPVRLGLTGTP